MIIDEILISAADAANGTETLHGVVPADSNSDGDLSGLTLETVRFNGDWQPHRRPRGYTKGGFVSSGERSEVSVEIAGRAWGYDRQDANRLYRRLLETLQPDGDNLPTLTFTPGDYGPVEMKVALERVRANGNGPATIDFNVEVVSADGIAHGTARSVPVQDGNIIAVPNEGNASAYPTITLTADGPVGNLMITNGPDLVVFEALQVDDGDVIVYETEPGREALFINGNYSPEKFARPRIGYRVLPGGTDFICGVSSGSGGVSGTVEYRDAWMVA